MTGTAFLVREARGDSFVGNRIALRVSAAARRAVIRVRTERTWRQRFKRRACFPIVQLLTRPRPVHSGPADFGAHQGAALRQDHDPLQPK